MKLVLTLVEVVLAIKLIECGPPGKPALAWGKRKFAIVEVSPEATSYKHLVKRKDFVELSFSWNIWTGDPAEKSRVLFNDEEVWSGTNSTTASFNVSTGGTFEMTIEVCNKDGCDSTDPTEVVIADTDGQHLAPLKYSAVENSRRFNKTSGKIIAAYYTEWGVYKGYSVDHIPVSSLTHLLYAFIPICGGDGINDGVKTVNGSFKSLQASCAGREDFKVSIHDPWAALQRSSGISWDEEYKGNYRQLMMLKRSKPSLTILPSIGGWTLSDPFFFMKDKSKRKTFVESVREFLKTWKFFDGIDIDWEFPGGGGVNPDLGSSKDNHTYLQLLKELRKMLDNLSKETGKTYELTSAVGAAWDKIQLVDYKAVQAYLDHIFLMTYDFKGSWSNISLGHQTALYGPSWNPDEKFTVDHAVKTLLAKGVDSKKVCIGVAMYGRGWTGIKEFKDNPFTGVAAGPIKGSTENGTIDYKEIVRELASNEWEYTFDNVAKAPYMFRSSTGDLITFDDEMSVIEKGKYVVNNKLGGLFAWSLDEDNGDILNAMNMGVGNTLI